MTISRSRDWPSIVAVLTLAGGLAVAFVAPARANLVFDFGSLAATGSSCLSGDCVLGSAAQSFTTGGITVGADSYVQSGTSGTSTGTDVSQRFGASGGSETGLGVYTQGVDSTTKTDSTLEISSSEYLLLDNSNAIANGYALSSLSLASIQSGEGGAIEVYGASSIGGTLILSELKPITTLSNPDTGTAPIQTYNFSLSNDKTNFIVVTADNASNTPAGNVLLAQVTFAAANTGGSPVPEPSTLPLYGTFVLGLAIAAWRRRAPRADVQ